MASFENIRNKVDAVKNNSDSEDVKVLAEAVLEIIKEHEELESMAESAGSAAGRANWLAHRANRRSAR